MILVNLSQDKSNINPYISSTLVKSIEETLNLWEKIILYLNKRWEYSCLVCKDCQKLYKCNNCDNSLSVHKHPPKLACHLCWHSENIPAKCNNCNSLNLEKVWIGTQQIESSLKNHIDKSVKIFRFDTDSIKNKTDKKVALDNLREADIIIWTKMITTWFDFEKVWLIGVILLEQELQIPKYNTEEKVYSNIKQLLWRWNRLWKKTEIILQSFIPENDIIKSIALDNYKDFFLKTLEERKLFSYPPFTEMVTIEYRDKSKDKALNFITKIFNKLEITKETEKKEVSIELIKTPIKKYSNYYYKIIIKWNNLRDFLETIKFEIMRNKGLVLIFE